MKIGLVRHFEVVRGLPQGWLTSADIDRWVREYNDSDIRVGACDMNGHVWRHCLSSDHPRALRTAQTIHNGEIVATAVLREPVPGPIWQDSPFRLPYGGWRLLLRLAWMSGHRSQAAVKADFDARVQTMADELTSRTEDTLVVGHGAFFIYLRKALLRRGFKGPRFGIPENGRLYVFEKG